MPGQVRVDRAYNFLIPTSYDPIHDDSGVSCNALFSPAFASPSQSERARKSSPFHEVILDLKRHLSANLLGNRRYHFI